MIDKRKLFSMSDTHKKVLVLEDDADTLEEIVQSLKNASIECEGARDSHEFLKKFKSAKYYVAVIDYFTPGIDAEEVLHEMYVINPFAKAVMISGVLSERIMADLYNADNAKKVVHKNERGYKEKIVRYVKDLIGYVTEFVHQIEMPKTTMSGPAITKTEQGDAEL